MRAVFSFSEFRALVACHSYQTTMGCSPWNVRSESRRSTIASPPPRLGRNGWVRQTGTSSWSPFYAPESRATAEGSNLVAALVLSPLTPSLELPQDSSTTGQICQSASADPSGWVAPLSGITRTVQVNNSDTLGMRTDGVSIQTELPSPLRTSSILHQLDSSGSVEDHGRQAQRARDGKVMPVTTHGVAFRSLLSPPLPPI